MPSRQPDTVLAEQKRNKKLYGSGGIRTHASEETGALNQRLRPLGHATLQTEFSQCLAHVGYNQGIKGVYMPEKINFRFCGGI